MFAVLFITFIAILILYFIFGGKQPHGFPPGPKGIPLFGYIPFMGREPGKKFMALTKQYGDIIGLNIGTSRVVVLNGLENIKNAFKDDVFCGRPYMDIMLKLAEGKQSGIVFHTGQDWYEQRRFTLRHLKDFGFGKASRLEEVILLETTDLIENLRKDAGKRIDLEVRFHSTVINALWSLVTGKRMPQNDTTLATVFHNFNKFAESTNFFGAFLFLPWLYKRLPVSITRTDILDEIMNDTVKPFKREIELHQKTFYENSLRDLIDVYLYKIYKTTDEQSGFYGENGHLNLRSVILDLFIAGTDTTSTTLRWMFLVLMRNPHIKQKIFREIDQVVGRDRMASFSDRSSMPYTEACILEILRYSSLLPLAVPHLTTQDTVFKGFNIPKGTVVLANILSVLHSPEYWEKPDEFYPEHFLTENGQLKRNEALIPFSSGKRICIGERLAQDTLFLIFTNVMQNFDFSAPPGESLPSTNYKLGGIARRAQIYNMVFRERQ